MELTNGQIKHIFIPTEVISFPNIRKTKILLQNDAFTKFEAITEVKCEYIVCNDITKTKKSAQNQELIHIKYIIRVRFIFFILINFTNWVHNSTLRILFSIKESCLSFNIYYNVIR